MRTFPLEFIHDAVEDEENVRPDGYSGRGMYGKTCASVSFDSVSEALTFFATLGQHFGREADENDDRLDALMDTATVDGMGLGIVAYFPGWTFA